MSLKPILIISMLIIESLDVFGQTRVNQFSSEADTLIISTTRKKGIAGFNHGGIFLEFQDTTNLFNYPIKLPKPLSNVLGIRIPTDFKYEVDYIDIITGQLSSQEIVIIADQNNNQSFLDDSLFTLQPFDWDSSKNAIPVSFLISDGADTIEHQSWIRIGKWHGGIIYGRNEYLSATITIDDKTFEIGIIDPMNQTFTFSFKPEIALLSDDFKKKDTIAVRDLIKRNEYLLLNEQYYKFDSINNDGSKVVLIKEPNFERKVGIQVGMIAPEFEFKSTKGDTINTFNLHDRPIIIANACGCGGDTQSTEAYFEIRDAYQAKAYVLRIDSFSESPKDLWTIDMEDQFNQEANIAYRKEYCSRICYVIGLNNRIIDKFEITDWKNNLPNLLKN